MSKGARNISKGKKRRRTIQKEKKERRRTIPKEKKERRRTIQKEKKERRRKDNYTGHRSKRRVRRMERSKRKREEIVKKKSLRKKEKLVERGVKNTLQEGGFFSDALVIFGMAKGLAGQMKGGPFRAMFDKYIAKKDFEKYISSFKRDGGDIKFSARTSAMLHHSKMLDLAEILKDHIPYSILYEILLLQDSFWLTTADDDRFNDWIDVVLPTAHMLIYIDDKYTRQLQYFHSKEAEKSGDTLSITSYLNAIRKVTYMYQKAKKDSGENLNNWFESIKQPIISAINILFEKIGFTDEDKGQLNKPTIKGKLMEKFLLNSGDTNSKINKTIDIIAGLLMNLNFKKKNLEGVDDSVDETSGTEPVKDYSNRLPSSFVPIRIHGGEVVYKYKARVFSLKELIEEGVLDRERVEEELQVEDTSDKGSDEHIHETSYDNLMKSIFDDVESEYNKYNILFTLYQQFINIDSQFSIVKSIFREYARCDSKMHILTDSNIIHNTMNEILNINDGMKYSKDNISVMSQSIAIGLTAGLISAAAGLDTSAVIDNATSTADAVEVLTGGASDVGDDDDPVTFLKQRMDQKKEKEEEEAAAAAAKADAAAADAAAAAAVKTFKIHKKGEKEVDMNQAEFFEYIMPIPIKEGEEPRSPKDFSNVKLSLPPNEKKINLSDIIKHVNYEEMDSVRLANMVTRVYGMPETTPSQPTPPQPPAKKETPSETTLSQRTPPQPPAKKETPSETTIESTLRSVSSELLNRGYERRVRAAIKRSDVFSEKIEVKKNSMKIEEKIKADVSTTLPGDSTGPVTPEEISYSKLINLTFKYIDTDGEERTTKCTLDKLRINEDRVGIGGGRGTPPDMHFNKNHLFVIINGKFVPLNNDFFPRAPPLSKKQTLQDAVEVVEGSLRQGTIQKPSDKLKKIKGEVDALTKEDIIKMAEDVKVERRYINTYKAGMMDPNGDVIKQKIIEKKIGLSGGGIQGNKYYKVTVKINYWYTRPSKPKKHDGVLEKGTIIKIDSSDYGKISEQKGVSAAGVAALGVAGRTQQIYKFNVVDKYGNIITGSEAREGFILDKAGQERDMGEQDEGFVPFPSLVLLEDNWNQAELQARSELLKDQRAAAAAAAAQKAEVEAAAAAAKDVFNKLWKSTGEYTIDFLYDGATWKTQTINCYTSYGLCPLVDSELNMVIYEIDYQDRDKYAKYMFKEPKVEGSTEISNGEDNEAFGKVMEDLDSKLSDVIAGLPGELKGPHRNTYYYDLTYEGVAPHELVAENKLMKDFSDGSSLYSKLKAASYEILENLINDSWKILRGGEVAREHLSPRDRGTSFKYIIGDILLDKRKELVLKYNDHLRVFPKKMDDGVPDWSNEKNLNDIDNEVLIELAIILSELKRIEDILEKMFTLESDTDELTMKIVKSGEMHLGVSYAPSDPSTHFHIKSIRDKGLYLLSKVDEKTFIYNYLLNYYSEKEYNIDSMLDRTSGSISSEDEIDYIDSLIKGVEKAPGYLYSTWLALSYSSIIDFNFRGKTGAISKGVLNAIGMSRKERTDMRTIEELLERTFMKISNDIGFGYTTFLIKKGIPPCLMGRLLKDHDHKGNNIDGVNIQSIIDFMLDDPEDGQEDIMMRKYYIDTIENHYVGVNAPSCKNYFCHQGTDYTSRVHKNVRLPLFKHLFPNQENKLSEDNSSMLIDYTISCNDILYILPYIRNNCSEIKMSDVNSLMGKLNELLFEKVNKGEFKEQGKNSALYINPSGKYELSEYIRDIYENDEWLIDDKESAIIEESTGQKNDIIESIEKIVEPERPDYPKHNRKLAIEKITDSILEMGCFKSDKSNRGEEVKQKIENILASRYSNNVHSKLDKIMEGYDKSVKNPSQKSKSENTEIKIPCILQSNYDTLTRVGEEAPFVHPRTREYKNWEAGEEAKVNADTSRNFYPIGSLVQVTLEKNPDGGITVKGISEYEGQTESSKLQNISHAFKKDSAILKILDHENYGDRNLYLTEESSLVYDGHILRKDGDSRNYSQVKLLIGDAAMGTLSAFASYEITKIGLSFTAFAVSAFGIVKDWEQAAAEASKAAGAI